MKILIYPDSRLTDNNLPISDYNGEVQEKVAEMFKLMYETNGVGLAAPQVGWNVRLFIINTTGQKADEKIFWNPTLKMSGELISDVEGCLSFPKISAWIKRPEIVEISANTPAGPVTETHSGLMSRAIQHEYDHLEGMLFIERFSPADMRRNNLAIRALRNRATR